MPLLGAETFYGLLEGYRVCWIGGRFSGGKTSFAFLVARHFLERGYRLVTNCKTPWADPLDSVQLLPDGHLKVFLLLDEGGLWWTSNQEAKTIAAYAAKMDLMIVVPSFFPPASFYRILQVQPLFTLRHVGLPFTLYRWRVASGSYSESGKFVWAFPQRDGIYGVYSRQDPGDTPFEIADWVKGRLEEFRAFHGRGTNVAVGPAVDAADTQQLEDAWARVGSELSRALRPRRLW